MMNTVTNNSHGNVIATSLAEHDDDARGYCCVRGGSSSAAFEGGGAASAFNNQGQGRSNEEKDHLLLYSAGLNLTPSSVRSSQEPCFRDCGGGGGGNRSTASSSAAATLLGGSNNNNSNNDDILSKDMSNLTFEQRTIIAEEIHGVRVNLGDEFEDDAETNHGGKLQLKLNALQTKLNRIPTDEKEQWKRACFLAPAKYGPTNQKFHLMFLRSTKWDVELAAKKIVDFFQVKAELWGVDKVAKDITLEDFSEDDMAALRSGSNMILPIPDMPGRKILFSIETEFTHTDNPEKYRNKLRVDWYILMTELLSNDGETVQKRGFVYVIYDLHATFVQQAQTIRNVARNIHVIRSIPNRITSFHYCYEDPTLRASFNLVFRFVRSDARRRFCDHFGGHMECQYALMSYGIPIEALTIDQNGNIRHDVIENCIQRYKIREERKKETQARPQQVQKEAAPASTSDDGSTPNAVSTTSTTIINDTISAATDKDVLLGRGIPYQFHPGNKVLSNLIDSKMDEYFHCSSKFEKTMVSWNIVKYIQTDIGGRFLERDNSNESGCNSGRWKVVSDDVARLKVAYGFRSKTKLIKKQQAKKQQQQRKQQQQQHQQQQHSTR